ncbi:S49 family peptidase [candidate division KSB1 bacterium]|nr:S49 family peptidase [candidate division KSB1 bacterium]
MKNFKFYLPFIFLSLFLTTQARAFNPNYRHYSNFLLAPSETFQKGILGYQNPAMVSTLQQSEMLFRWTTDISRYTNIDSWGLFSSFPHLGFGVINTPYTADNGKSKNLRDYRAYLGLGDQTFALGFGLGIQTGRGKSAKFYQFGSVIRPIKYLSLGLSGTTNMSIKQYVGRMSVGVRPFGTDRLTLLGEYAKERETSGIEKMWSVGGAAQVFPGLNIIGRMFDDDSYSLGVEWSLGFSSLGGQMIRPDKGKSQALYSVRMGGNEYNVFDQTILKKRQYVTYELRHGVSYRKYKYFSSNKYSLLELLTSLDQAIKDPAIAGVALNLSDMRMSPEMVWEVREKLKAVRAAGKHVIVYFNDAGMTTYHLASVADKIVMDPIGTLLLNGNLMGRTYYKNLLEKVGLGFQEWRLFTHKTANESYSRTDMSEADKEQRMDLIQARYNVIRNDICKSRDFTPTFFDSLIDNNFVMTPEEAFDYGMVDTLTRWTSLEKVIQGIEKSKKQMITSDGLANQQISPRHWGALPRIAVVYALGVCDVDKGIQARRLERIFFKLAKSHSIDAVVLRVDSPGGDAYASDLVAEAMKKCAEKKPVLVSQGYVAASGGYWISMCADTIVAAPFTITGSIGVIGGWLWNNGIGEKLGLTSDHVQIGKHADLGFGVQLPLIGVPIPDRNLTQDEQQRVELMIRSFYNDFVSKVAANRGQRKEHIESIAQGRVWPGTDAQLKGLVDEIGGLETTIVLAKQAIGLNPKDEIEIIELPGMKAFNPDIFTPSLVKTKLNNRDTSFELDYLEMIQQFPGRPLPIASPDLIPEE